MKHNKTLFSRYVINITIALQAILQNKLRAALTSLGIIFGVASVIAMLSIGKGAEAEIIEKMKALGTNNIIINANIDDKSKTENEDENQKSTIKKFSNGLSIADLKAIERLPYITNISPEIVLNSYALHKTIKREIKLIGTDNNYFTINSLKLLDGKIFNNTQLNLSHNVCIIGNSIKTKLFAGENPLGKQIKCENDWFTIIGVLDQSLNSSQSLSQYGVRDLNYDVYIPHTTMLLKIKNRSLVTKKTVLEERRNSRNNSLASTPNQINQLDRIIININSTENIKPLTEIISRMMKRRHNEVEDYEIIVPELLIQQEQSTKKIFNLVLGVIASISLIVGGIGIMNIMLASVLERTKEIGVRLAVGAFQKDILFQFLSEAVAISLSGGILGIILGITLSLVIEQFTDIVTIISFYSILLSFFVSISVGLIFGIAPARKASKQNPIDLLRYE